MGFEIADLRSVGTDYSGQMVVYLEAGDNPITAEEWATYVPDPGFILNTPRAPKFDALIVLSSPYQPTGSFTYITDSSGFTWQAVAAVENRVYPFDAADYSGYEPPVTTSAQAGYVVTTPLPGTVQYNSNDKNHENVYYAEGGDGAPAVQYYVTDAWGNVYILKSLNAANDTPEKVEAAVAAAVLPEGWTKSAGTLPADTVYLPTYSGDLAHANEFRDSADSAWMQIAWSGTGITLAAVIGEGLPIWGGRTSDLVLGTEAGEVMHGGEGSDVVLGLGGDDDITGDDGDDIVVGDAGDDTLAGGNGIDQLYSGGGDDSLAGGDGDDVLWGEGGGNRLSGGAGNDRIDFTPDDVASDGGDGVLDLLLVMSNPLDAPLSFDLRQAENQNTTASGTSAVVTGYEAIDAASMVSAGGFGIQVIGAEHDGGLGAIVFGSQYADTLTGSDAVDILFGNGGADLIDAGAGNDSVLANGGDDTVSLGAGEDFLLYLGTEDDGVVRILDFVPEEDWIGLAASIGYASGQAALDAAVQLGADVVLNAPTAARAIILVGIDKDDLTAADFEIVGGI